MKIKINEMTSAVIAIVVGLFVLSGYFFVLGDWEKIRENILEAALVLAATAFILGVINLLGVHLKKMREGKGYSVYSGVLVVSMLITFVIAFLAPDGEWTQFVFTSIQVPVESTIMAVLSVSLIMAVFRMVQTKPGFMTWIFTGTILITLAGSLVLFGLEIPVIDDIFSKVLASAGARGILLGVSLGTVATGLRIFIGVDRPYGN